MPALAEREALQWETACTEPATGPGKEGKQITACFMEYLEKAEKSALIIWGATYCALGSSQKYAALISRIESKLKEGVSITLVLSWTVFANEGENALLALIGKRRMYPGFAVYSWKNALPEPHGIFIDGQRGFLEAYHNETDPSRDILRIDDPEMCGRILRQIQKDLFQNALGEGNLFQVYSEKSFHLVGSKPEWEESSIYGATPKRDTSGDKPKNDLLSYLGLKVEERASPAK